MPREAHAAAHAALDFERNSAHTGQQRHGEETDQPDAYGDDGKKTKKRSETLDPPPSTAAGVEENCSVRHRSRDDTEPLATEMSSRASAGHSSAATDGCWWMP